MRLFTPAIACMLFVLSAAATQAQPPAVKLLRVPDDGIQPQAVVDAAGKVHLIYCKGDPKAIDIFYVTSTDGGDTWAHAIRVNSVDGSAMAIGNIRGPQIALGRNGRVHVAWNGSPKVAGDNPVPMLYTRLNDDGSAFEPQRNVISEKYGINGGGSVAADDKGNVYVVWHAPQAAGGKEDGRHVFAAISSDDGKTFAAEKSLFKDQTGACGCCGMKATVSADGSLAVLYRSATENIHRDMYYITGEAPQDGNLFTGVKLDTWDVNYCVMSLCDLHPTPTATLAAWESKGQVGYTAVNLKSMTAGRTTSAPGSARDRKYPTLAVDAKGNTLLAWGTGMGWNKGGGVAWQIFDAKNQPIAGAAGNADGVPVWSLVAAFVRPDGQFAILY